MKEIERNLREIARKNLGLKGKKLEEWVENELGMPSPVEEPLVKETRGKNRKKLK